MKRALSFFMAVVFVMMLCLFTAGALHNDEIAEDMHSPIYMLVSLDNDTEIFSKGADVKTAPATFVKIITAITVIENCPDLDAQITVNQQALDIVGYTYGMVTSELSAGEEMSIKDLLYCCMLQNANDATNTLAWHVSGGDMPAFVNTLNDFVKKIGCENTVLVNATGIDAEGQYTTAQDMVKIISYGLKLPVFSEIFNAKSVTIPATNKHAERTYSTANKMMFSTSHDYYYEYVTGGKSGATNNAGNVFTAVATKDGYSYLAVVMKGETKIVGSNTYKSNCAILDAKRMLRWTFSNIKLKVVANTSQVVSVIDVVAGKSADNVRLVPASEVSALVPADADYTSVLIEPIENTVPKSVRAPVHKGDIMGEARILYAGQEIARVSLAADESVELSVPRYVLSIAKMVVTSTPFIIIFSILVALIAVYIGFTVAVNYKNKANRLKVVSKK